MAYLDFLSLYPHTVFNRRLINYAKNCNINITDYIGYIGLRC